MIKKKGIYCPVRLSKIFILGFIFLSSCASIVSGGIAKLNVASTPKSNFKVMNIYDNTIVFESSTPASFNLKTSTGYFKVGKYDFIFNADGYQESIIRLEARLNAGWYIVGNLFFGGWLGWLIVDPITGAMYTFENDNNIVINAHLTENSSYNNTKNWNLQVVLISDPRIQTLKNKLIKIN